MENKISLVIRHTLTIVIIIGLIFIGLDESVWQDAPQFFSVRSILFLLMVILVFTGNRLEKRRKFREDIGMDEQWTEGKISKTLRKVLRIIFCVTWVAFVVLGVLFSNRLLFFCGSAALALIVISHFVHVRRERKKQQAALEQEGNQNEPPSGSAQ